MIIINGFSVLAILRMFLLVHHFLIYQVQFKLYWIQVRFLEGIPSLKEFIAPYIKSNFETVFLDMFLLMGL